MDAVRKGSLTAAHMVHVVSFSTELPEVETFEDLSSSEVEDLFRASADGNGEDDDEPLDVNAKLQDEVDPGSRRSSASEGAEGNGGQDADVMRADIGDEDDHDGGDESDEGEVAAANPLEREVERRRIRRCATVGQGARHDFEFRSLPAASRLWQRRHSVPNLTLS